MSFRAAIIFAATFAATPLALSAQSLMPGSASREEILLQRIRVVAAEMMLQLPDYTCTQTIERSRRPARSKKFELVDNLRLEVALVGNRELFAWPGATQFEERDIMEMVGGGAIGTGDFAIHAKNVLLSNSADVISRGVEDSGGRRLHRFDFVVPRPRSAYLLRVPPETGLVGYRGSYWVDTETMELARLSIDVDDIPSNIPLKRAKNEITYQRVRIGGGEFLLPSETQLVLDGLDSSSSRNRTTFANCRKYSGESVLSFDDPPDAGEDETAEAVELPSGLGLNLKLLQTVDVGSSARGDQVRFLLTKDASSGGRVWLPKGAEVTGRLLHKYCWNETQTYCVLQVRLEQFRSGRSEGPLAAKLEWPDPGANLASLPMAMRGSASRLPMTVRTFLRSGEVVLVYGGANPRWPSGSTSLWRTQLSGKPSVD
jgi:hypothetical protein